LICQGVCLGQNGFGICSGIADGKGRRRCAYPHVAEIAEIYW
jgi:hypothetical protein